MDQITQHLRGKFTERANDGAGCGEVFRRAAGAQQADAGHAGRIGGRHARRRILDDRTAPRHNAQSVGRNQKHLGIGLAAGNVGARDNRSEQLARAKFVEDQIHVFGRGRGSDGKPEAGPVERFEQFARAGMAGKSTSIARRKAASLRRSSSPIWASS